MFHLHGVLSNSYTVGGVRIATSIWVYGPYKDVHCSDDMVEVHQNLLVRLPVTSTNAAKINILAGSGIWGIISNYSGWGRSTGRTLFTAGRSERTAVPPSAEG